ASLMRLPLQTSRPLWLQYCQTAYWTNRGKVCGNAGLNCRASIRSATAAIMSAQPPGAALARMRGKRNSEAELCRLLRTVCLYVPLVIDPCILPDDYSI